MHSSHSHVRDWVFDDAGNVIETHEHAGDFKRVVTFPLGYRIERDLYSSGKLVSERLNTVP